MLMIAAALMLLAQDPPPGEIVRTAPPPAPAATLADPFAPTRPRSTLDPSTLDYLTRPSPREAGAPTGDAFDRDFAASRRRAPSANRTEPLPQEALDDPVRYAARQCRPEMRPASEGVAECFDRIDRAVRDEQDRRAEARRPRTTCTNSQSRDDDGRTSSTSGRCSWGTGDPAVIDDLLDRW